MDQEWSTGSQGWRWGGRDLGEDGEAGLLDSRGDLLVGIAEAGGAGEDVAAEDTAQAATDQTNPAQANMDWVHMVVDMGTRRLMPRGTMCWQTERVVSPMPGRSPRMDQRLSR
jgi:hypothetical protein